MTKEISRKSEKERTLFCLPLLSFRLKPISSSCTRGTLTTQPELPTLGNALRDIFGALDGFCLFLNHALRRLLVMVIQNSLVSSSSRRLKRVQSCDFEVLQNFVRFYLTSKVNTRTEKNIQENNDFELLNFSGICLWSMH